MYQILGAMSGRMVLMLKLFRSVGSRRLGGSAHLPQHREHVSPFIRQHPHLRQAFLSGPKGEGRSLALDP